MRLNIDGLGRRVATVMTSSRPETLTAVVVSKSVTRKPGDLAAATGRTRDADLVEELESDRSAAGVDVGVWTTSLAAA